MKTVGDGAGMPGKQAGQPRIIGAEDQRSAGLLGKLLELAANRVEIRVIIQMLFVDVQNDGQIRMEFAQRPIAFVGFDDEQGESGGRWTWCVVRGAWCVVRGKAGVPLELRD